VGPRAAPRSKSRELRSRAGGASATNRRIALEFPPVDEQLEQIRIGAEEIIREEELRAKLERSRKSGEPLRIKQGFDPSASDLHLGHTVGLRKLAQFQRLGHEVIFLVGDFTGRIGDPSGKKETRRALTKDEVLAHAKTYTDQVFRILDRERTVVDWNSRWYGAMAFEDVLDLASKYTVARLLERDDFAKRYRENRPISMVELLYPLVQGYDSVALRADVELGGTDQKFNLLVGRDLQREYGQEPQVILTVPLLVGTDGKEKMSKSIGNYIAITDSPKEMFGKTMSIPDSEIINYFALAADVTPRELEEVREALGEGANPRDVKARLAARLVALYHGAPAAVEAEREFERIFRDGAIPDEIETLRLEAPPEGLWIARLLQSGGFAPSSSAALRFVREGAVYLDDNKVSDDQMKVRGGPEPGKEYLVRVGRKKWKRIQLVAPEE
jgi:tyrosyl-tRNA synthetase